MVLEVRSEATGTSAVAHLTTLHRDLGAFDRSPRWVMIFEHFRVVPRRRAASPQVVEI